MFRGPPRRSTASRTAALAVLLSAAVAAHVAAAEPAADDGGAERGASEGETGMRDPLRPPDYRAATGTSQQREAQFDASAWQLASTLVSRERRAAIINGRNVREGGRVGGATVIDIQSGRVTLDYRGRRFTIRNPTPSVRLRERAGERSP